MPPVTNKGTRIKQYSKNNDALCKQLGYVFTQPQLLHRALTHRSHSPEHYERLEFLGDSILGCVIANYLYNTYPQLSEGDLSRIRSHLVKEDTLVSLAQKLDLGSYLALGEGERKGGGFRRPSILADALEALFGAVMLDGGFAEAGKVVLGLFVPYLDQVDLLTLGKDAKTLLQEHLQARHIPLPEYTIIDIHGQAHEQSFEVDCVVPSLKIATRGTGNSRRSAEQQAAQAAYQQLTTKESN